MVFQSFARYFGKFWDKSKTRRKPNPSPFTARRKPLVELLEDRLSPATLSAPIVQNTYPFLSPTGGFLNTLYNPQVAVDPTNPNNIVVVANQVDTTPPIVNPFPYGALVMSASTDGGTSWSSILLVNGVVDPQSPVLNPFFYERVSDPSISFDRAGKFYIVAHEHDPNQESGAIVFYKFDFATLFREIDEQVLHRWYRGPAADPAFPVSDSLYSPVIAIDNNVPTYTDPQTGMVQTDTLATLIPDPNNPGELVPKGIYIGWTSREVSSANNALFNGPIGIAKLIVSGDGGATFSTAEDISEGNTTLTNSARPQFFFTQGTPYDPTNPNAAPRIQGGLLGVIFDEFGTQGRGLVNTISLPDGGNASQKVGITVHAQGNSASIIDAAPQPTQPNNVLFDRPQATILNLPVNITDPDFNYLTDMEVSFSLIHPHLNELEIELVAPDGTTITLLRNRVNPDGSINPGANGQPAGLADQANLGTVNGRPLGTRFNQKAFRPLNTTVGTFIPVAPFVGTFQPELGDLAVFNGLTPADLNGTWQLRLTDNLFDGIEPGPAQSVTEWSIKFSSRVADQGQGLPPGTFGLDDPFILPRAIRLGDFTNPYPVSGGIFGGWGITSGAVVAIDNTLGSFSPFQGRAYVSYTGNDGNIYLVGSDAVQPDGIALFAPFNFTPVNDDTSADYFSEGNRQQFMPTIAVDQSTGTLVMMWYDGRNDPAGLRVANYITTSIDGGITFSEQVPFNVMTVAKDALTREKIIVEPIPGSQGFPTFHGFGFRQSLIVDKGRARPFFTSNRNAARQSVVNGVTYIQMQDVYVADIDIGAGPRILVGDQGPVVDDFTAGTGLFYNNTYTSDGRRQIDGFLVTFDRPVDPASFTPGDVAVKYQDPNQPAGNFVDISNQVLSITPLDISASHGVDDSGTVPTLVLNDAIVQEPTAGQKFATLTVTMSQVLTTPTTVNFTTSDGSALGNLDYTPTTGKVTIPAGKTSATFTIPILTNPSRQGNNFFWVGIFTIPSNVTTTKAVGRVTILDSKDVPTLVVGDGILKEGDAGAVAQMVFPILLSNPASSAITVTYGTTDGTGAVAGTDYTTTNGSIIIPAGITSAQITVPVLGNALQESNRTFYLNLVGQFARSEQQTIILSNSGNVNATVTLGFLGETATNPLSLRTLPTAATVQANLETIPSLLGNISVTSPVPGTYLVTFTGGTGRNALAGLDVPLITIAATQAGGTGNVTQTIKGGNTDAVALTRPRAIGLIVDDDDLAVSVGDVTVQENTDANATVTFFLNGKTSNAVTATFNLNNTGIIGPAASAGTDYNFNGPFTVTIPAGATSATVAIPIVGNTTFEPTEKFNVTVTATTNAGAAKATGIVTIVDDDAPAATLFVTDLVIREGDAATPPNNAAVTLRLSNAVSTDVTGTFATATGGTATGGATAGPGVDFLTTSVPFTIPAGQTSVTVNVPIVGDLVVEDDETVRTAVSAVVGGTNTIAVGRQNGTVTIVDDDVHIYLADATDFEAGGVLTFTAYLDSPKSVPISFQVSTMPGTATDTSANTPPDEGEVDYVTVTAQTVTIPAGQTSVDIPVTLNDDDLGELTQNGANEAFTLNIDPATIRAGTVLAPANSGMVSRAAGIGTIVDDDEGDTLTLSNPTVLEDSGQIQFDVFLSQPQNGEIVLFFYTEPDPNATPATAAQGNVEAQPDDDYVYTEAPKTIPPGPRNVFLIMPGQTQATITVPINPDVDIENDETFYLTFDDPSTGTWATSNVTNDLGHALGTILNDDRLHAVFTNAFANEGSQLTFNGVLSNPRTGRTVTATYVPGSAVRPQDYTSASATATSTAAGLINLSTNTVADNVAEGAESFTANFTSTNVAISTPSATGNILDAQRVSIAAGDFTTQELPGGTVNALIPVYLTGVPAGVVTVDYSFVNGTAVQSVDYNGVPGTLTFDPADPVVANRTRQFITVPILSDGIATGNKVFSINFGNPVNAGLPVRTETQTLAINGANNITFAFGALTATASAPGATLTAGEIQTALRTMIPAVTVTALPNTGTQENFLINFNNSVDVQNIGIVQATNESATGTVTAGQAIVTETQKGGAFGPVVTIVDADKLPTLTIGAAMAIEGNSATAPANFTIISSFPTPTPVAVTVNTANGTATTADNDYTPLTNQTVTIPAGATSAVFAVSVRGDTKTEGNETFTANLSAPSGATISTPVIDADGTLSGGGVGVGTIVDDDSAPTISIGDISVKEPNYGSSISDITVYLSRPVDYPVTFTMSSVNGTALGNVNYTPLSTPLTIPAGATSATFPIQILADGLKTGDLEFTVVISGVSGANIAKGQANVFVQDGDTTIGATVFLVRMTPQNKVGTYSYTVGPSIGDRIRTALPSADAFEAGTGGSYTPNAEYLNLSLGSLQPTLSQINVSGLDGTQVLRDLTVTVNIIYPDPSNFLTIDLFSPSGHVVNLFKPDDVDPITNVTTPLGNLFNTTFDERSAVRLFNSRPPFVGHIQPAINDGVPYVTTPLSGIGLITAVPIHMLYGESPNGIWTLRVTDASGATNTGILTNWSLNIDTGKALPNGQLGNAMDQDESGFSHDKNRDSDAFANPSPKNGVPFELPYDDTTSPLIIPGPHPFDFQYHYVSQETVRVPSIGFGSGFPATNNLSKSSIVVAGIPAGNLVSDVNVTIDFDAAITPTDLIVTLVSPQGRRVRLSVNSFLPAPVTFDDQTSVSSPFGFSLPAEDLTVLNGFDPNGTWTLEIEDTVFPGFGTLLQWRLDIAVEPVVVNTTTSSLNLEFDRDINVATFVPANILRAVGPAGAIAGPFTITPISPRSDTVVVGGVSQPGTLARKFTIGFPLQFLSGTYSFIFGQDVSNPNGNTNYVADALGNKLDNNLNAGLSVTRGADPTDAQLAVISKFTGTLPPGNLIGGRTTDIPINVTDAFIIQYLTLSLDITIADVSRLSAALISPSGTIVPLFNQPGAFASNRANMQNVTLDDAASTPIQLGNPPYTSGTFNPQRPLSTFIGETTKGVWTLQITNTGATGTVNNYSLNFTQSVPGTGLGEQGSDQFQTHFRIFVQDPTNPLTKAVWTPVGPTAQNQSNSGGIAPIPAVAVDPADPSGNTVYVGTSNGGVWKTSNFLTNDPLGPSYVPLLDFAPISSTSSHGLAVGSIGVFGRNRNPNQSAIFVGSGGSGGLGVGVLRSLDGGRSWKVLDSLNNADALGNVFLLTDARRDHRFVNTQIQTLVVDPNPGPSGNIILYIAVKGGSNPGIYRSTDAGDHWEPVRVGTAANPVTPTDIVLAAGSKGATGNLSIMYAGFANEGVFFTSSATTSANLTRLDGNQGVNYRVKRTPGGALIPVPVSDPPDTPTTNAGPIIKLATPALTGNPLLDTVYQGFIYAVSGNVLYVSKDFGNNWTHVRLNTRISPTGAFVFGTNDDVYVNAAPGNLDFPSISAISVDPQNPNAIFLQFTGPTTLNPTNIIRVDITNLQDPYDLVEGYNQANDGGSTFVGSQGGAVATGDRSLAVYGIVDPNDPSKPKQDYTNALRDPDAPFLQPTGQEMLTILVPFTNTVDRFTNSGKGARYTNYYLDIASTVTMPLTTDPSAAQFRYTPSLITVVDPNTGLTRIILAGLEGLYTALDDGAGHRYEPPGKTEVISGNRSGNIAAGLLYDGASQPSILAADIAQALFYGSSYTGTFHSSSSFFGTGNIDWKLDNGPGRQTATDPSGTGIAFQYIFPDGTAVGNPNLLPGDFFQIVNPGALPISRVSGLLQAGDNPASGAGQWPSDNSPLQYPSSQIRNTTPIGRFATNPVDPTALLIGSQVGKVFRSNTASTGRGIQWFQIAAAADLDGTYVDALAFGAPSSTTATVLSDFIYAGTVGGRIFVTNTGGGTGGWRNISGTGLDGSAVIAFAPNPKAGSRDVFALTTRGVFYLADSSVAAPAWVRLNDVAGKDFIFTKTRAVFDSTEVTLSATFLTDLVADWRYAIPNTGSAGTHPVLYVSTDGAVYRSTNMGLTWVLFPSLSQGAVVDGGYLPNVVVTDLDLVLGNTTPTSGFVNESNGFNMLYATTFGRSAFAIRLDNRDVEVFRTVAPFGPQVVGISAFAPNPQTTLQGLDVSFSNTIDPATFTPADIAFLVGPGNVSIPVTRIEALTTSSFRIHFAPQSVSGTYTIRLGPAITDFAGNLMDQNNNSANGETTDFFQGVITFIANTPPTFSPLGDVAVPPGSGAKTITFTIGDGQEPPSALVLRATSSNQIFVPDVNLVLGGSGANRTLTITPVGSGFGVTVITLTLTDTPGLTTTVSFNFAVDNPPTLGAIADQVMVASTANNPQTITIDLNALASDPDAQTLTFLAPSTTAFTTTAYTLDQTIGLTADSSGTFYPNLFGQGNKWLIYKPTGEYFVILPNGELHRYATTGNHVGPLVIALDPSFNADPTKLFGLINPYPTFVENLYGLGEKWMFNPGNQAWYAILKNGELHQYGTAAAPIGALIATFSPGTDANPSSYWVNPTLITEPPAPVNPAAGTATVTDGILTIAPPFNFTGSFQVTARVSDGFLVATRTFTVTVFNRPPSLGPIANQIITHSTAGNPSTITINLASNDPDAQVLTYSPSTVGLTTQAYFIDTTIGLIQDSGTFYPNLYGFGERWLFNNQTAQWFAILPNGNLHRYGSPGAPIGPLAAEMGLDFYYNPQLLIGLTQFASYAENKYGLNEKWIFDAGNQAWYMILPNGELHAFNTPAAPIGALVATFPIEYWADPTLITEPPPPTNPPANTFSVSGNILTVTPPTNFVGAFTVNVAASDGVSTVTQSFTVTVYDHRPTFATVAEQIIDHAGGAVNIPLNPSDPDAGDTVTFTTQTFADSTLAFDLDFLYGFVQKSADYNFNQLGQGEKQIFGAKTGRTYLLVPDAANASQMKIYLYDNVSGSSSIAAGPIPSGILPIAYYTNPALLHEPYLPANPPAGTVTVSGGTLTITPPANFIGSFNVLLTGTDGMKPLVRAFKVTITDRPPTVNTIANVTMSRNDTRQITVAGSDPDATDVLSFSILSPAIAQTAFNLDNSLGLVQEAGTYYGGLYGQNEKWIVSSTTGTYYAILPSGALHQFGSAAAPIGILIANLPQSFYVNPALLHEAATPIAPLTTPTPPPPTAGANIPAISLVGNLLTITPNGFVGQFQIMVLVSDGSQIGFRKFLVTTT